MCGNPGRTKKIIIAVVAFCILLSYAIFFILPTDVLIRSTQEDGIFENCTAIFYVIAALLSFVLFFSIREGNDFGFFRTSRNLCFLIMGLIFFLIFGEEISWGQRIFGVATPGFLEEINVQREIGFHNIWVFRGMFRANRLLQYFCFVFAVLLPLVHATVPRLTRWIRKINIPIVPISISLLFVGNYIISRVFNVYVLHILKHSVIEIMEFNIGLLFLGTTIWFLSSMSKKPEGVT